MRWPDCAPLAPPGTYEVTLEIGSDIVSRHSFRLFPPPGVEVTAEDLAEQFTLLRHLRDRVEAVNLAFNRATRLRSRMEDWVGRLVEAASDSERELGGEGRAILETLTAIRDDLVQWRVDNPQDQLNFPPRLNGKLAHVFQVVASADARPTSQTYEALKPLDAETDAVLARLDDLRTGALARFNERLRELRLPSVEA